MELPLCPNFILKRGCERSDMMLLGEGDDYWTFHCRTCKLVHVVSKQGVQDKSKFEVLTRRRQEQETLERLRSSRRKIFA